MSNLAMLAWIENSGFQDFYEYIYMSNEGLTSSLIFTPIRIPGESLGINRNTKTLFPNTDSSTHLRNISTFNLTAKEIVWRDKGINRLYGC